MQYCSAHRPERRGDVRRDREVLYKAPPPVEYGPLPATCGSISGYLQPKEAWTPLAQEGTT
ncbi:hypothetical protein DIPPA_25969 [Diplonema papillatum]|nr:hypothetical protein DIPPA_25969 [Diplonema papillatum]